MLRRKVIARNPGDRESSLNVMTSDPSLSRNVCQAFEAIYRLLKFIAQFTQAVQRGESRPWENRSRTSTRGTVSSSLGYTPAIDGIVAKKTKWPLRCNCGLHRDCLSARESKRRLSPRQHLAAGTSFSLLLVHVLVTMGLSFSATYLSEVPRKCTW